MSIDATIKKYGIKYMFVESGKLSILSKCEEIGLLSHEINSHWHYWVELSWGSGDDEFDFAFNNFGKTFDEAFAACMTAFKNSVSEGESKTSRVALKYNL